MKSLIISDVDTLDLKYLPLICDIVTHKISDFEETEEIYNAANWFIERLLDDKYEITTKEDIKSIEKFIKNLKYTIQELNKDLFESLPKIHPSPQVPPAD